MRTLRDALIVTAVVLAVTALFWIFVFPAHAQEDPYGYFRNYDFSGGLNSATSPFLLQDNEAADIKNLFITTEGAIETRGGFSHHSSLPAGLRGTRLFRYYKDGTAAGEWICQAMPVHGTTGESYLMDYNDSTTAWGILFKETAIDHFHDKDAIANFLGRLYVTNDLDGLRWYEDPTGTGEVSTAPKCRFLTVHGQRLYMAGDPSNPFSFYFSGLRDGTVWDDVTLAGANAGYWKLPSQTGGAITGLANWKGYLLVFTESAVWALQGDYPDEASITEIASGIGCSAPHSLVEIGGEVFFKSGARVFKMGVPPIDVSKKVFGSIYASDASEAVGWNRNYVLVNTEQSHEYAIQPTVDTYLYDIDYDRWTKFDNLPYHAAAVSSASRDQELAIIARNDSEEIAVYNSAISYDAWGNFDTVWKTRVFHLGTPELNKRFRHLQLDVFGSTARVIVDYDVDYARITGQQQIQSTPNGGILGSFIVGTSTLGGASDSILKFPFPNRYTGKVIQFQFSTSNTDEHIKLYGYVLRYRQKPFRGSAY